MGNSLGDETSCESSSPQTYSSLNVLAPNGQWFLRKTPLNFTFTLYTTNLNSLPVRSGLIGSVSVYYAEDPGSRLKCATVFFFLYYYYYLFN